MRHLILVFMLSVIPMPSSAASWFLWCGSQVVTAIAPGQYACASPSSNTDDTALLAVAACENWSVFQFDDKDGSGSVSLVTGTVELCPDLLVGTTAQDNGCAPLPGTTQPLSADDADYGADGVWMRIEAGGTNTNPTQMRWIAKCAQPSAR